jgi:hypothetical protein
VHKISPLGLLCVSGVLGATGLTLLSNASTVSMCILAATVYACGKTFLWPTMLAVASEQFPKGGAVSIGFLGGVGMLSAGLLGGPAIGFKQDYNASAKLQETSKETYDRYKADNPSSFFGFSTVGLNGAKVGVLEDNGTELARATELLKKEAKEDKNVSSLNEWWNSAKAFVEADKEPTKQAGIHGGKMALKYTAYVPATMAVVYLLLLGYFASIGGYKPVSLNSK